MKYPLLWAMTGLLVLSATSAMATARRDPNGVNVSTSGSTTLTIRFADDAGGTFTTTQAFFCSVDPTAGAGFSNANTTSCAGAGGQILGRLPAGLDRGSTTTGTSAITDVMTIPFSVTRRAVVQARQGQQSDFFYVRRLVPTTGAINLGAGAGVPVLVVVTCRLTGGTSRTPLSLTKVVLYGKERTEDGKVLLIRVTPDNLQTGKVQADIRYTGTGVMSGWWEVRTPGDSSVRELDRFTEGSISEAQRRQQQRFQRVKRFRVQMPLSGRITLRGPTYKALPKASPGVYEILLRVEASRDRESLSTLAAAGGTTSLFSGAAAGFPLPALEYRIGPGLGTRAATQSVLEPRIVMATRPDGMKQVAIRWTPADLGTRIVRIDATDPETSKKLSLLAKVSDGFVVIPPEWTRDMDLTKMQYTLTAIGANRRTIGQPIIVRQ